MFIKPNPFLASTSFNTQSNSSSYFNDNISLSINMLPNFHAYKPQNFERSEASLPEYFNNLFLYERIWTPLNAQATPPITINTESSSTNYQSMTIQKPMAHSTPRAIRKTLKCEEKIQNFKKEEQKETVIVQNNAVLRPKKVEIKQTKPKPIRKISTRGSLESSNNSFNSFSPKSNSSNSTKKLPLRSQGIDLSQYLHKNFESGSSCASSSFGNDSCFNKYQNKEKVNVQNKCLFCENNGESEEVYMSHPLKDSLGKVVCPILRNYTCPKCGESGDYAHTNKYCPETQRKQKENKIKKYFNHND